jgi:hypothetical protein
VANKDCASDISAAVFLYIINDNTTGVFWWLKQQEHEANTILI